MANDLTPHDVALLVGYLHQTTKPLGNNDREHMIAICEQVIASLRTPIETARKYAFLTLDDAIIQTAIRLNVFGVLSTGVEPKEERFFDVTELAASTRPPCPPVLLSRFLRYLAQPLRLVTEQGPEKWGLSESGRILALQSYNSGSKLYSGSCSPAFRALPEWMASSHVGGRSEEPATPFKTAMPHIGGDFFDWLREDAARLHDFHTWMHTLAEHQHDCQQRVDFAEFIPPNITSAEVAFVDIGGGSGTQCITLRQKCGENMHGRIVNQDRPEVVAEVASKLEREGIEMTAHNFFTEQPIKGAHIYHFRQILHDWPDDQCVKILRLTRDAMTEQSILLIDEVVMPQQGAHWMVTQRDLTMLALFNAGERTEDQWRSLLLEAGLVLHESHTYDERIAASLLIAKIA